MPELLPDLQISPVPSEHYDVIIIGSGPAGMSAALECAQRKIRVLLLDEQDSLGGQIYRSITRADKRRLEVLGPDYAHGASLTQAVQNAAIDYWPYATVWQVTRDHKVSVVRNGKSQSIQASQIILATGAMERPFPIKGWTLPGAMTGGAGQILLKSAGVVPTEPAVLAGCGPLLYLLAYQYLRAGVPVAAILDTTETADYTRALPYLPSALMAFGYLRKGLSMLRAIKNAGVPIYKASSDIRIEGETQVTGVRFKSRGKSQYLATELVLLHQGVIPNTQISWSLRAEHLWDTQQLCWRPVTNQWGELDVPGIYVAGDGSGIGGALIAAMQGRLAGLAVSHALGKLNASQRDELASPISKEIRNHLRIRPFLDTLYQPKVDNRIPHGDVVVCRCEELQADAIHNYVAMGCSGPNQAKAFGRCGMGPCQGRQCGTTVTELIAVARKRGPAEVGYYRIRPPIKPITLAELAGDD